jgi:hypothetical protein
VRIEECGFELYIKDKKELDFLVDSGYEEKKKRIKNVLLN